jgi:hypothetical protein
LANLFEEDFSGEKVELHYSKLMYVIFVERDPKLEIFALKQEKMNGS